MNPTVAWPSLETFYTSVDSKSAHPGRIIVVTTGEQNTGVCQFVSGTTGRLS